MEGPAIKIRPAEVSDFEAIYEFINELEEERFDKARQYEIYSENIQRHIYIVATIENQVIGYISCHVQLLLHHGGPVGEIQEMFVQPEYRNRAIGKLLLTKLKEIADRQNVIQLEVTSKNHRVSTHKFYLRESFILTHQKFVFAIH